MRDQSTMGYNRCQRLFAKTSSRQFRTKSLSYVGQAYHQSFATSRTHAAASAADRDAADDYPGAL